MRNLAVEFINFGLISKIEKKKKQEMEKKTFPNSFEIQVCFAIDWLHIRFKMTIDLKEEKNDEYEPAVSVWYWYHSLYFIHWIDVSCVDAAFGIHW